MPKGCNVYGCRGNYRGEPYTPVVKCPDDPEIRRQWLDSLPNERSSLEKLKEIWVCRKHFDCEFIKSQGGSRPTHPPTLFDGVLNSCRKQVTPKIRGTKFSSAEKRIRKQHDIESKKKHN